MALKKVSWKNGFTLWKWGVINNFPGEDTEDCQNQFELYLHPYFRKAGSHCMGLDEPFIANFFTRCSFPPHGDLVSVIGEDVERTFYDTHIGHVSEFIMGSPNIKIVYNNVVAGVLCPKTQTLWATDWTHDRYMRPATQTIITKLVELGLLRPVSESEYEEPQPDPKEPEKITYPEYSVTMGCDPEFEVVENGRVRQATQRLGRSFNFNHPEFGNFGLDGAGDQVELRPSPGEPETVVKNIRELLGLFGAKSLGEYTIAPSSDRFPCGGHIHIGVQPRPPFQFYSVLIGVLDDFIGLPTKRLNGERRGNGNYGSIHDWSEQNHGIEYRTPPGTIFRSPELGRVVLQLGYNLAYVLANARELEYESNITVETLVSVGGLKKEDAEFFLHECGKEPPNCDECLLAAWGVVVEKPKPQVVVEFGEEWTPEVQRYVRSFLENAQPDKVVRLHFFGLSKERGNVYTFKVKRRGKVDNHPSVVGHPNSFGFSRKFRFGGEFSEKMNQILETVMGILKIKIGR
jgi:hypothetical protein